jgi:hypothetical protein
MLDTLQYDGIRRQHQYDPFFLPQVTSSATASSIIISSLSMLILLNGIGKSKVLVTIFEIFEL